MRSGGTRARQQPHELVDVFELVDAPREVRMREADNAQSWYKAITVDAFG